MEENRDILVDPSIDELLSSIRKAIEENDFQLNEENNAISPFGIESTKKTNSAEYVPIVSKIKTNTSFGLQEDDFSELNRLLKEHSGANELESISENINSEIDSRVKSSLESDASIKIDPVSRADPLVSQGTADKILSHLSPLVGLRSKNYIPTQEHLDSILKPLLSQWLENNLSQIVEKIVRDEIQRLFSSKF